MYHKERIPFFFGKSLLFFLSRVQLHYIISLAVGKPSQDSIKGSYAGHQGHLPRVICTAMPCSTDKHCSLSAHPWKPAPERLSCGCLVFLGHKWTPECPEVCFPDEKEASYIKIAVLGGQVFLNEPFFAGLRATRVATLWPGDGSR